MSSLSTYEVIILGAGPAGISVAVEAISKGIAPEKILILEKSHEIMHMISTKYPDEKPILANYKNMHVSSISKLSINDISKKDFIQLMNKVVEDSRVQIQFNNTVIKVVKLKNGQLQVCTNSECYIGNSVFIAIGSMSTPRKLNASIDQDALNNIYYDIQNIEPEMTNILVIGGGDSAAEYAMILSKRGHNVSLSYRGTEFNRMIEQNSSNLNGMIAEGKISYYPHTEIKVVSSSAGKLNVTLNNAVTFSVHAIVGALGTEKPANYLDGLGIQLCYEGLEIYSESSLCGVYVIGDLASTKGGTINLAFNSGAKAFEEAYFYYLNAI